MNAKFMDSSSLFAEAQRVFARGDGAGALKLLDRLPATVSMSAQVLHFRALALKKTGQLDKAKKAFEYARRAAPRDPEVANNYANLLMQIGMAEAALPLYDSAVALKPDYYEARLNRVLALQAIGRMDQALADLDELIATGRADARAYSARGTMLLALDRHDEAAAAFDRSVATGQRLPTALHGRARVALERGEVEAAARYRLAYAALPGNREVLLGLAEALEADGDPGATALLAEAVAEHPDWVIGLERLARMRAEAGDADFADHYRAALGSVADQRPIRLSLAKILADSDRHGDALEVLAPLPEDPTLTLLRAFYLGEAGDPATGLALFDQSDGLEGGEALMIAGRLAIATGDLDRALALLDHAVAATPDAITVWAHLELAWRAVGDTRAEWLSGQRGLVSTHDLGLDAAEISAAADVLRSLHRTNAHPIGQSLRGGTQTRGRLFWRQEPEIRRLHEALQAAITDHLGTLPPADPSHPLLKHRDGTLAIAGSWSVRLTGSGFHVHHIHSQGLLSSACYLALPEGISGSATRAGWLELGRPPPSLNLELQPIASVEPAIGRLALFPSYLYHGTRPFVDGERLAVAFDVVPR